MVLMPRVTIVDADKISDEAAAAVAEVSQMVNGALRVKLHDKHAAQSHLPALTVAATNEGRWRKRVDDHWHRSG